MLHVDIDEVHGKRADAITEVMKLQIKKSSKSGLVAKESVFVLERIYLMCLVLLGEHPKDNWMPKDVEAAVEAVIKKEFAMSNSFTTSEA